MMTEARELELREERELVRARSECSAYRLRATQAEQSAADWRKRFDALLNFTRAKP